MNPLDLLLVLAGVPALPGARCRGRAHLFDDIRDGEHRDAVADRHNQALGLCQHCPALDQCRNWIHSLPPNQRPRGVVAGTIGAHHAAHL